MEMETLSLFGHYYRDDVMGHPEGDDHRNIRNFLFRWLAWHSIRQGRSTRKIINPLTLQTLNQKSLQLFDQGITQ